MKTLYTMSLALLVCLNTLVLGTSAQENCVAEPQLAAGAVARVTPGAANNVREEASADSALVGQIPGGALFSVTGGPLCDDRYVWIEVDYADFTGWTVEATASETWVEPVAGALYEDPYIRFLISDDLVAQVEMELLEATDYAPARRRYTLRHPDKELEERRQEQRISLVQADDECCAELEAFLDERPDLSEPIVEGYIPGDAEELPEAFFPLSPLARGAARIGVIAPHYINTPTLRGVAFITTFAQMDVPFSSQFLEYRFLGLTNDGETFIEVRLWVTTDELPPFYEVFPYDRTSNSSYQNYLYQETARLNALPADAWEPTLDFLDGIVQSISVLGE